MYVDAIDSDAIDWELKGFGRNEGDLNGMPVTMLNKKDGLQFVRLESGKAEGLSLKNRKIEIEPMMNRISEVNLEYKHTNSDGSSDSVRGGVKFNEDRGSGSDNSTSENTNNNTQTSDVDLRDQDQSNNTDDN